MTSLDLTAAYASFGNGGYYYAPYSYYYVEDSQGKVIIDNRNPKGEQIMKAETADVMRHLLQTVTTAYNGTGVNYKVRGFTTYAKTGTTDNLYDKWFVSGTPYYIAATWYGYDIPRTIYCGDSNPAGIISKTVMDRIHEDLDDDIEFEDTGNVVQRYYCTYTGKLASSSCYSTALGWYNADDLPDYCGGHYYSGDDDDEDYDDDDSGSSSSESDGGSSESSDSGDSGSEE